MHIYIQEHVDFIKEQNERREQELKYMPDRFYNSEITVDEVRKAIYKSKNNKAPGLDSLTYEVLKNYTTVLALTKLFNFCFDRGIIPTTWSRGLINPIPKSASSDPRVPLNYRGYQSVACHQQGLHWNHGWQGWGLSGDQQIASK